MALNHEAAQKMKRMLHLSTLEGMAYGGMVGLGEYFTGAFAVALKSTNTQLALLTSLPNFVGALAQAPSAGVAHLLGTRKRVVLTFALLQGLMWLPMVAVGLVLKDRQAAWLISFVALYAAFGALVGPAWTSIVAEVVPRPLRGHYFGGRTRWATLATVLTSLAAGLALWMWHGNVLIAFSGIFVAAFALRMVSVVLLTTLVEVPHGAKDEERVTPFQFIRTLPSTNLGRMMLYIYSINFSVNLAGPFFTPYMLRELQFSYPVFTAMSLLAAVASLWSVTHWGNAADRVGNRRLLVLSGLAVSILPILWMVWGNPIYLGLINFIGGAAWAGFNLTSANFIFDATTSKNRIGYLALFNSGAGIASGVGALAGGVLISHVPAVAGSLILTMFLISGSLRLLSTMLFMPVIREVRRVTTVSSTEVFHLLLGGGPAHRPHPHSWGRGVHPASHHTGVPGADHVMVTDGVVLSAQPRRPLEHASLPSSLD